MFSALVEDDKHSRREVKTLGGTYFIKLNMSTVLIFGDLFFKYLQMSPFKVNREK